MSIKAQPSQRNERSSSKCWNKYVNRADYNLPIDASSQLCEGIFAA